MIHDTFAAQRRSWSTLLMPNAYSQPALMQLREASVMGQLVRIFARSEASIPSSLPRKCQSAAGNRMRSASPDTSGAPITPRCVRKQTAKTAHPAWHRSWRSGVGSTGHAPWFRDEYVFGWRGPAQRSREHPKSRCRDTDGNGYRCVDGYRACRTAHWISVTDMALYSNPGQELFINDFSKTITNSTEPGPDGNPVV